VSKRAGSFAVVGVGSSAAVDASKWASAFGNAMVGTHASMTLGAPAVDTSGVAGAGTHAAAVSWKIAYTSGRAGAGSHASETATKRAQANAQATAGSHAASAASKRVLASGIAAAGTFARGSTTTIRYTSAIAIAGGFARMSSIGPVGIPAFVCLSLYDVTSVTFDLSPVVRPALTLTSRECE
jgi:hypothetical protein